MSDNTQSLTTEQRIAIVADFSAEKIKEIKELMEEEVLNYEIWRRKNNRFLMDEIGQMPFMPETETDKVKSYQQSKTK